MSSSRSVPTMVIGPKGLLRDGVISILSNYSYRVTDSRPSADDLLRQAEDEVPRMVILTARTMNLAISEAARVRETCPTCKIVVLLEDMPSDFQKLEHSAVDGCVPVHVSEDVLVRTLDLVMSDAARVVVFAADFRLSAFPCVLQSDRDKAPAGSEAHEKPLGSSSRQGCGTGRTTPERLAGGRGRPFADASAPTLPHSTSGEITGVADVAAACGAGSRENQKAIMLEPSPTAELSTLSERERQIIDGLIMGHPNKTIARACGITEATVKVHMKAILRKVPATNRTQVAIWALARGYGTRDVRRSQGSSQSVAPPPGLLK